MNRFDSLTGSGDARREREKKKKKKNIWRSDATTIFTNEKKLRKIIFN